MRTIALPFRASTPIASGVQGGSPHPLAAHDTVLVVALILAMAAACALLIAYLVRRGSRAQPVRDQWQALTVMGELCPHGWQARVNLYGWGAPVPSDAPSSRVPLVELEWQQFDEEPGRVVVARRVWAPTIDEALAAMVDDRRTDLALEEIERAGEEWWTD